MHIIILMIDTGMVRYRNTLFNITSNIRVATQKSYNLVQNGTKIIKQHFLTIHNHCLSTLAARVAVYIFVKINET